MEKTEKPINTKLAEELERLRKDKVKLEEQLGKFQTKSSDYNAKELDWKQKLAKIEQANEKSTKISKDKIRQLENLNRKLESDLGDCKAKIGKIEELRNQDEYALHKYKTKGVEKEYENKLSEKENEIK